ncbi:MAG: RDD family protein [Sumerlaeia bacterium]
MPQISPFLKPQPVTTRPYDDHDEDEDREPRGENGRAGGGGGDDGDGGDDDRGRGEGDDEGGEGEREELGRSFGGFPKLPVVGFWYRFLTILFDFITIYLVFRLLSAALTEPLMAVATPASLLALIAAFFYFALGNGPVGKGRTLGKMLTGLRTVNYRGEPPTLLQSSIRTAVLFPFMVLGVLLFPISNSPDAIVSFVYSALTGFLSFAALLASILAIAFNPYKQGLHDFCGKTYVVPGRGRKPITFDELAAILGDGWRRYNRQPQYYGVATLLLVFVAFVVILRPTTYPESARATQEEALKVLRSYPELGDRTDLLVYIGPETPPPYDGDPDIVQKMQTALDTEGSTIGLHLTLSHVGAWPAPLEERKAAALDFAREYREILFENDPDALPLLYASRMTTQDLAQRPIVFFVNLQRGLNLVFPYEWERQEEATTVRWKAEPYVARDSQ